MSTFPCGHSQPYSWGDTCETCDRARHGSKAVIQPETKTVLGRVFHKRLTWWVCPLKRGLLLLFDPCHRTDTDEWLATLEDEDEDEVMRGTGPTETDAILALQSTLRKMAELEVTK